MSFHDVRLPTRISSGARGGSAYNTTVLSTSSGHERRNINWANPLGRWDISYGFHQMSNPLAARYLQELIDFFHARMGKAYGFRFKDFTDYAGSYQYLGTGDGERTEFQIVRAYSDSGGTKYRAVKKPVAGTVKVYNGTSLVTSGKVVDLTTGVITFTSPPGEGEAIYADFEFDVPVRFDFDQQVLNVLTTNVADWPSLDIVEIRI